MSLIKNNPYYQKPEVSTKIQGYAQGANAISSLLPVEDNPYAFDKNQIFKGAGTGASIGTSIMPGLGSAVGAVGGALIGGATAAIKQGQALDNTQTSFDTIDYDEYGQPIYSGGQIAQGISNLGQINAEYENGNWGSFNRRKMRNTRNELSAGVREAQDQFNQANMAYSQNLLAKQRYEDELRKNNIYNFPMQLV